jgi:predicted RNA-binding protein
MAKKKAIKKSTPNTTESPDSKNYYVVQQVTIQEPQPDKFKIVPGKHDGLVWGCHPRRSNTIEKVRKDFLKSISKTSASFLTQEQIDDFLKVVEDAGFRIKMPLIEWKKNFARRFQRFLERKGITLEQIEQQGFSDASSKRWLRNLYKNGIHDQTNVRTMARIGNLYKVLGITNSDDF